MEHHIDEDVDEEDGEDAEDEEVEDQKEKEEYYDESIPRGS